MADDQDQDKQFQNQSQKIHICLSSNDAEKYASMEVAQAQIWTVINIHEVSTLSPVRPHWRQYTGDIVAFPFDIGYWFCRRLNVESRFDSRLCRQCVPGLK